MRAAGAARLFSPALTAIPTAVSAGERAVTRGASVMPAKTWHTSYKAASAGNTQVLVQAAHSLKGSSRNVGARSLADISQRLETLGKGESLAGANEWIDQLEQEFYRVKGTLPT